MKNLLILLTLAFALSFASCSKQEYKKIRYVVEHQGYGQVDFDTHYVTQSTVSNSVYDTTVLVPIVKGYTYLFKIDYSFSTADNESTFVNILLYSDDELQDVASYAIESDHEFNGTVSFTYTQ